MKYLNRLTNVIISPISNEPVFWSVIAFALSFSHILCLLPESMTEVSVYDVRNILIIFSGSAFISWCLSAVVWRFGLKKTKCLLYVIAFLLMGTDLFLLFNFGTILSSWILLLVKETNATESSEFLSRSLFTGGTLKCLVIIVVLGVMTYCMERKSKGLQLKRDWLNVVCALVALPVLTLGGYLGFWSVRLAWLSSQFDIEEWRAHHGSYALENTFTNLFYSVKYLNVSGHDNAMAIRTCVNAARQPASSTEQDSLNVILVIGESYNKYHSPLYGYYLNTTPVLCSQHQSGNLFVFKDVVATYNMTTFSMKNMLSTNRISDNEAWHERPYFPVIFKKAGFNVSMWDNQRPSGADVSCFDYALGSYLYAEDIMPIAYNEHNTGTYDYDDDMLSAFTKQSRSYQSHRSASKHSLYIFHLMGQHSDAANRFPETDDLKVFKASDIRRADLSDSQKQIVADYDNATRYNDYVIGRIINMFKHSPSVIVYLSDHGEEVYDYRNFVGRTHERNKKREAIKYQYDIPMMIWCSGKYIQNHPQLTERIREALGKPMSSDLLPHLLFRLASIKTPFYKPENDVLDKEYVVGKRILQGYIVEEAYSLRSRQ